MKLIYTVGVLLAVSHAAFAAIRHLPKMVGYDVKDNKYYSVAYVKAHHRHDREGDPLIIIPSAKLPANAKMSHAMHGRM